MTKGERIRARRKALKLTQSDLAEALGTTKQNIYKYEMGIVTNIPSDKIEALSKVLQVTPGYLMGWGLEPDGSMPDNVTAMPTMKKVPTSGTFFNEK